MGFRLLTLKKRKNKVYGGLLKRGKKGSIYKCELLKFKQYIVSKRVHRDYFFFGRTLKYRKKVYNYWCRQIQIVSRVFTKLFRKYVKVKLLKKRTHLGFLFSVFWNKNKYLIFKRLFYLNLFKRKYKLDRKLKLRFKRRFKFYRKRKFSRTLSKLFFKKHRIYLVTKFNNTFITAAWGKKSKVLFVLSAGQNIKGSKRTTFYAGQLLGKKTSNYVRKFKYRRGFVCVRTRRKRLIRSILYAFMRNYWPQKYVYQLIIPHNGLKLKKKRRV